MLDQVQHFGATPHAIVRPARADGAWVDAITDLPEMRVHWDAEEGVLWQSMRPQGRPCVTLGLIRDALRIMDVVEEASAPPHQQPVNYMVLTSDDPAAFCLGGDLALFKELILSRDEEGLRHYAHGCVDVVHRAWNRLNLPLCMIALVQGDALGGGFETALAHDVIIAERRARFGLPEILFNLFPGMGAYSFLSRRLTPAQAERMIVSGRIYTAEELHEMGIVDVVAPDGEGLDAVQRFIDGHRRASKARNAVARLRGMVNPVTREELIDIADLWVETALRLEARDLRKMEHLVAAQMRRSAPRRAAAVAREALA